MRDASLDISRPLFWPWNSGSRMKTEISAAQPPITSSAVTLAARLVWPMRSAWSFSAAQQRDAQARLVRAAVGRRDGVAIGVDEAVVVGEPGHGPFDRAVAAGLVDLAGEGALDDRVLALDVGGEIVAAGRRGSGTRLRRDLPSSFSSAGAHFQRISTPPKR